ncbi:GNAT family N-acetyltransferase [Bradyrhizobium sp. STM 3557]|uniref:GNAT family N-acetyltransferase n=1 Tax=Bradyrhizobium sp. STM 3557 TaxID=578920 RepID=UPI00388EECFB
MTDISERALVRAASDGDAAPRHTFGRGTTAMPLAAVPAGDWCALAQRTLEPNGYYLPDWELAVNASARGRTGVAALYAYDDAPSPALIGLMPVISLWRTYKLPLPALVSGHPYGTLCTPLLDSEKSDAAATRLLQAARSSGAHALVLRDVALDGVTMGAIATALGRDGLRLRVLHCYERACLDATRDGDEVLQNALGAKKLKELRRQRHRLAEHGTVDFAVARSPTDVAAALETFLSLEASGWKGRRGTALIQHDGDAAFIRRATAALAATNQCEIVTLRAGDTAIAAGVVLRHQGRAFFFKLGVDERFAKYSPGVQLTLDLTRHLCADPAITSADSTAGPDHPMINPIWRGRFAIGDVLIPLYGRDPMVELIDTALRARRSALDLIRRGVHAARKLRKT